MRSLYYNLLVLTVIIYGLLIILSVNGCFNGYLPGQLRVKEKCKAKGFDEPLQFVLFHKEIRTREGEEMPRYVPGYKTIELNKAVARARAAGVRKKDVIEWKERGPSNVPGRTRALFNIPYSSNNHFLAGAATGGIWKTVDGGNTWIEKNSNLTSLPISSYAADKAASKIYAGTGEYISTLFSALGDGIFVSTDKGESWSHLTSTKSNPDFAVVTRLIVDPDNPNVILATTVPSKQNRNDVTSAIMRSTDGGLSWTKSKEIEGIFEQIVATPSNFQVQYASQNGVGVWKSFNGGITWFLSNTNMYPSGRVEIAVSPFNANKIFASAEGSLSETGSDLYVSTNAGATWALIDVKFNGQSVDFLGSQGFYDNTIMCDPFNENIVYIGGVNLFRCNVSSNTGTIDNYSIKENNTTSFLFLQSFSDNQYDFKRLYVGGAADKRTVEIRFGPGQIQKAHRFIVPDNATSNVQDAQYTIPLNNYYVNVPFTVWDVTEVGNQRQLMVSFRDQNKNENFDLLPSFLTNDGQNSLDNSREYVYIHNVVYKVAADVNVLQTAGHKHSLMYTIFPALASNASWPANVIASKLVIKHSEINKFSATTVTVADAYNEYDGKNKIDQQLLHEGLHPDHHAMVPVIIDRNQKTYKILLGNDGGVFVSNIAVAPGINEGNWDFKGFGYNTGQFYGVDKKPNSDVYIGGLQDNGTRISPAGETASATTRFNYALGGDGFEVLWHNTDPNKILGSVYNGNIYRTTNGGGSWQAGNGLSPGPDFPFVTKLANSKDSPDRVFTVSRAGVHVSNDFGATWNTTYINNKFVAASTTMLDVEVSRANANIIWAGSGMSEDPADSRNLFVSTNGGKNFLPANNFNLVMGTITKLGSHPHEPNTAYAIFSFAHAPKILRTKDLGNTWEDITGFGNNNSSSNGFPDVAVYSLYVRPDNPNIIWAGTEIGIVESVDNGATWALRNDFPKVAVWDMKGQDNQVVIATHGRGIWTATINAPQNNYVKTPVIKAAGTTPQGEFAIRITSEEPFDSIDVIIDSEVKSSIEGITNNEEIDIKINGLNAGSKVITLMAFRSGATYQSVPFSVEHFNNLEIRDSYSTYFNDVDDLVVKDLTLKGFAGSSNNENKHMASDHPYNNQTHAYFIIKHPIKVSSTLPQLLYEDIAIVEPILDYVVVEATKNGLDWIPISTAYDARIVTTWQAAYYNNTNGTNAMWSPHNYTITEKFSVGDTLLFKWRMNANTSVTSWGWAINFVAIQETPLEAEKNTPPFIFSAYPNPTTGNLMVDYSVSQGEPVEIKLLDITGRELFKHQVKGKAGPSSLLINFDPYKPGTYLCILKVNNKVHAKKIVLKKD